MSRGETAPRPGWLRWAERRSPRLQALGAACVPGLLDWAVHIDPEGRFVYFDNPKVASGTIKRSLWSLVDPHLDLDRAAVHSPAESPLAAPPDFSDADLEALLFGAGVLRFGFVREPVSRALSAYLDKIANPKRIAAGHHWLTHEPSRPTEARKQRESHLVVKGRLAVLHALGRGDEPWDAPIAFRDFLSSLRGADWRSTNMHWRAQHLNVPADRLDFDVVGRFERLETDLATVLRRIGSARIEAEVAYSTGASAKAEQYVDDEIRAIAARVYAEDYRIFGYDP